MMDTENKFKIDLGGELHAQINIPTQGENVTLPQRGNSNTFQQNKSMQEL